MVSFFVVFEHPSPGDFANLIEISEQPGTQHFASVGPIEAFNECVLIRFSRFDVIKRY